jgi:S1-C subfamily serine protease
LNNNRADEIEGIYEKYGHGRSEYDNRYSIAVIKEGEKYNIIYLGGARNKYNWQEGELKGTISQTSIKDFYKVNWVMADKSLNHSVYLSTSKYNFLEFDFLDSDIGFKINYLKMYPQITENRVSSDEYFSSGTGFLISDQGYLVTNHHIVGNSSKITVQFKNEEPQTQYDAEIILNDKKNDITILRLKDFTSTQNQSINLNICNTDAPIGTSVFTLGYPMIETMGEAVKLSDGIISSHSGYMANENIYQITVPINPGNSGGPLFDKSGNLVGIINAKYTGAENVSYAIKSSLLCDMIGDKIELSNNKSSLSEKNFVDQVEILNNLVCLIKVYN